MSSDREVPQMETKEPKEPTMEDINKLYFENVRLRRKIQELQQDVAHKRRVVINMIIEERNSIKKRKIV